MNFLDLAKVTDLTVTDTKNDSITVRFTGARGKKDGYIITCTPSSGIHVNGSCANLTCTCGRLQPSTVYQVSVVTIRHNFNNSEPISVNATTGILLYILLDA